MELLVDSKIAMITSRTIEFPKTKDILYVEGMENYCKVYLSNGKKYVITKSIGKMNRELEHKGFIQCHKSYIINLQHLCRYHKEGLVELISGHRIPVARRRREQFVGQLMNGSGI